VPVVRQNPGEGMRDGRQGRTDHPERRAHLADARIYVAGFGIGETSRLIRDGSKKTPKIRVLFLPIHGRSEILEGQELSK